MTSINTGDLIETAMLTVQEIKDFRNRNPDQHNWCMAIDLLTGRIEQLEETLKRVYSVNPTRQLGDTLAVLGIEAPPIHIEYSGVEPESGE